ncbi:MAG: hypothetical protein K9J06_15530 [Flavobacteriales bacterium]|nr:hypothetical protein [Flavobacteriales bacterium]
MRKSLFSNLIVLMLAGCAGSANTGGEATVGPSVPNDTMESTVLQTDTPIVPVSTVQDVDGHSAAKENPSVNEGSKEQKGAKPEPGGSTSGSGTDRPGSGVREHGSPQKSTLDSLKAAKTKGKD